MRAWCVEMNFLDLYNQFKSLGWDESTEWLDTQIDTEMELKIGLSAIDNFKDCIS
jgi:hypothetical protein